MRLPSLPSLAASAILLAAPLHVTLPALADPPSAEALVTLRKGYQAATDGLLPTADKLLTQSIGEWKKTAQPPEELSALYPPKEDASEVVIPVHKRSHSSEDPDSKEEEESPTAKSKLPAWTNPSELMRQLNTQGDPTLGDQVFGQQIHMMDGSQPLPRAKMPLASDPLPVLQSAVKAIETHFARGGRSNPPPYRCCGRPPVRARSLV